MPTTLYTVEQLELIRRLKQTGITVDAVVEAFHEMSSMESELDAASASARLAAASLLAAPPPVPPPDSTAAAVFLAGLQAQSPVAVPVTLCASPCQPPPCSASSSSSSASLPSLSIQTVPFASTASAAISSQTEHENVRVRSQKTPMREITTLDDPAELEEFMEQGEEGCIADMRQFITHYSLRQTTVAMMTGVSQPYISKLLNGNHRELSLRCRKNIYSWYLNCRRHPEKLSVFLADPSSRLETNGEGELLPQKRERYVFRPILLRLLENFFAETPFPDLSRRIEIATACNHALQQEKKGVGLLPKEVVSPQVVANWFANKRKELRRRSVDPTGTSSASGAAAISSPESSETSPSPSREEKTTSTPLSLTLSLPHPQLSIFEALGIQPFISNTIKEE